MPQKCSGCGAEIPEDSKLGACPKCLMAIGLNAGGGDTPVSDGVKFESFGDYELLEEIARGGMGVVYRARQMSLDRIVAVKMLLFGRLASARSSSQRFRSGGGGGGQLAASEHRGHPRSRRARGPALLRDGLRGGPNLAQLVRRPAAAGPHAPRATSRRLPRPSTTRTSSGILHRDLKPSNVLIDSERPAARDGLRPGQAADRPQPTVDHSTHLSGQVLGSPNYMPPEQAAAKRGQGGPAQRCLFAGRDSLSPADGPPAVRGRDADRHAAAGA